MEKRMDKYLEKNKKVPSRIMKNRDLYQKATSEYGEFEHLVVPSNEKAIDLSDLKKELNSRSDYQNYKEYKDIIDDHDSNKVIRKEKIQEERKHENEIYDIKELLNKAVEEKKEKPTNETTLTNEDYLKKLDLDSDKTNIEQVKEMYGEIEEESKEEDTALIKTANLSLDILSDLKGDNDETIVTPPIKEEELPDDLKDDTFYSDSYKFSKSDFEDKDDDNEDLEEKQDNGNRKFFFKILMLIFGISLIVIIIIYLFNYFNRV